MVAGRHHLHVVPLKTAPRSSQKLPEAPRSSFNLSDSELFSCDAADKRLNAGGTCPLSMDRSTLIRSSFRLGGVCVGVERVDDGYDAKRIDVTQFFHFLLFFFCFVTLAPSLSSSLASCPLRLSVSRPTLSSFSLSSCNQRAVIIFTITPSLSFLLNTLPHSHTHSSLIFCGLLSSGHS